MPCMQSLMGASLLGLAMMFTEATPLDDGMSPQNSNASCSSMPLVICYDKLVSTFDRACAAGILAKIAVILSAALHKRPSVHQED